MPLSFFTGFSMTKQYVKLVTEIRATAALLDQLESFIQQGKSSDFFGEDIDYKYRDALAIRDFIKHVKGICQSRSAVVCSRLSQTDLHLLIPYGNFDTPAQLAKALRWLFRQYNQSGYHIFHFYSYEAKSGRVTDTGGAILTAQYIHVTWLSALHEQLRKDFMST